MRSSPRSRRPAAAALVLVALAAATLPSGSAGAGGTVGPAELEVSGVPKLVGTRQRFTINVSGTVPPAFLQAGDPVSVVVSAISRDHVPEGYCPSDDVLLAQNVSTPSFSITKRVSILSELDFHDRPSYRYRICVKVFPNPLRTNQIETEASYSRLRAATPRVQGHHAALPHRVSGRVTAPDGSGVGGIRIRAAGGGGASAITGPSGRYDLFLGRGTATLTPSGAGATFAPASRRVKVPAPRSQDFVAAVPAG